MGVAAQCLHGAGLCLVPKPENDDRPWVLRHGPLSFISALLIVAKVLAFGIVLLTPTSAELSTITANRIVQLTNVERKSRGLNELSTNSLLTQAAYQKGQHMLDEDYFAHISPSGVTPWFWMQKVGYSYQVAGENLAIDFLEAEDVVAAWLASPTHKDNMLHTSYIETGVGVVTGEFENGTSTIVVHMFGLPTKGTAAVVTPKSTPTPSPAVKAETTGTLIPKASPTPSPAGEPSPSPSPVDSTPPRIPRIAVVSGTVVQKVTQLQIEGEPGSKVAVLLNNQVRGQVTLNASGKTEYSLALDEVPDGQLALRAYATDSVGNQSELSTIVSITKDTIGPQLAREQVSFIISPATDEPLAMAQLAAADIAAVTITQEGEEIDTKTTAQVPIDTARGAFTLAIRDTTGNATTIENISLAPSFATEENQQYLAPPTRFSQLTRRLSASIAVTLAILLLLAILVRIRIQRPAMIAHATFVTVLAAALFFL